MTSKRKYPETAEDLVRLLTTTRWITEPKRMTKRERELYVRACVKNDFRDEENARECASWRLTLARTKHGFVYGTDAWTDTAGHHSDFGYIPYDFRMDAGNNYVVDCPLTLALEVMAVDRQR